MKSILEELYFGDISPNEMDFDRDSNYGKALKTATDNEENLLEVLNIPEKAMLIDLLSAQSEIDGITAVENFSYGFKLGAMLMVEVLREM